MVTLRFTLAEGSMKIQQTRNAPAEARRRQHRYPAEAPAQARLAPNSQGRMIAQLQAMADRSAPVQRLQAFAELQRVEDAAPRANGTGMPDTLKSGIESLSGMSMDHVKVHRNSDKPAAVQAHAYAQGSDIHLAPGQERHLPHEAWHVVQQAQGRVRPTTQLGGVAVNDDAGLEAEADAMGARALAVAGATPVPPAGAVQRAAAHGPVQRAALDSGKLNLVGEGHSKNAKRRTAEKAYGESLGGGNYWREKGFTYGPGGKKGDPDDLIVGYRIDRFKRHIDDLATGYSVRDVKGMLEYCKRLGEDLNNDKKFPHQGQQGPMLGSLARLRKLAQGLKDSYDNDHSDVGAWQTLVNGKLLFIRPQFEQLNQAYEAITRRSSERDAIDARYARSDAMWIAAAKGGKTGLWMVGQNHIADIDQLHQTYQNEGTYNVLREKFAQDVKMQSKSDFEPQFQAWWTLHEGQYPK